VLPNNVILKDNGFCVGANPTDGPARDLNLRTSDVSRDSTDNSVQAGHINHIRVDQQEVTYAEMR
jgi:hypothetical protein